MIELIDQHANRTLGFVQLWHYAIRGAFGEALDAPEAYSRKASQQLSSVLRTLRSQHQTAVAPFEGGHLRGAIELLVDGAQKDAGVSLPAEDEGRIVAFSHDLMDETLLVVRDLLRTDESIVTSKFRKAQLEASLKVARGMDPRSAMNAVKFEHVNSLKLTHMDMIGRRWNSAVVAHREVRKALMDVYNHTFMWCLLHDGTDIASIMTSDGGKVFSITGSTQGVPDLNKVADLMHPNARFLVSRA